MDKNIPWPVAVIAMLVMGLLVGMWHGYWIAYVKVPPFIATLVGMLAFRGLANIIMKGFAYSLYQDNPNQGMFLKIFGGGDSCYIPGPYIQDKIAIMRAGFINQQVTGTTQLTWVSCSRLYPVFRVLLMPARNALTSLMQLKMQK